MDNKSYFIPDASELIALHWVISPGFDDEYLHIPTCVAPAACLPRELGVVCAAVQCGEPQPTFVAALKMRTSMVTTVVYFPSFFGAFVTRYLGSSKPLNQFLRHVHY